MTLLKEKAIIKVQNKKRNVGIIMQTVIDMEKMDTEVISPKKYLGLTPEQRRDISRAVPIVKPFGIKLEDSDFVAIAVKWKTPKYKVKF